MKNIFLKFIVIVTIYLLIIILPLPLKAVNLNNIGNYVFNKYFTLKDSIKLDIDNLLIGTVGRLLILGNTNKIVIFDANADKIIFIDLSKKTYKDISVESVMPGHKLVYAGLYKDKDNGFSVSSTPYFYFKFNNNAEIIRHFKIEEKYISLHFSFVEKPYFVFFSLDFKQSNQSLNLYNYKTGKLNKLTDVNFYYKDFNMLSRTLYTGGFLTDKDGNIYLANTIENKIYKYDKSGNIIKVFKSEDKFYKQMPEFGKKDRMETLKILTNKKYGKFNRMYFLNSETIIANYFVFKKGPELNLDIEIFDVKTGKSLTSGGIVPPFPLFYAEDDYIYLLKNAKHLDKNGNLPNPTIMKYKYNRK